MCKVKIMDWTEEKKTQALSRGIMLLCGLGKVYLPPNVSFLICKMKQFH